MAKVARMDKIARKLELLGLTVTRSGDDVVVDNGSNDLTISYVEASIQNPMGGSFGGSAPFLGLTEVANPGVLKIKSAINTAGTYVDVVDGLVAMRVLTACADFSQGGLVQLENSDASYDEDVIFDVEMLGMGQ